MFAATTAADKYTFCTAADAVLIRCQAAALRFRHIKTMLSTFNTIKNSEDKILYVTERSSLNFRNVCMLDLNCFLEHRYNVCSDGDVQNASLDSLRLLGDQLARICSASNLNNIFLDFL